MTAVIGGSLTLRVSAIHTCQRPSCGGSGSPFVGTLDGGVDGFTGRRQSVLTCAEARRSAICGHVLSMIKLAEESEDVSFPPITIASGHISARVLPNPDISARRCVQRTGQRAHAAVISGWRRRRLACPVRTSRFVMLCMPGLRACWIHAEGVFWLARRRFAAVWAGVAGVFAVFSSLVVGLAVNAVPKSWSWAHNWWLLIGISAGLLVAAVLVAVVQARLSPGGEEKAGPVVRLRKPRWSPVAASNTGTMISVKKVINKIIIGAAGVADLGKSSPASVVQRPGVEEGGRAGDTLPPRNPVFTGREDMLAEVGRRLADGPVAVVAVRGLGGMGKSQVALEYAHRMRDSGRYRVAGWVRADSAVMVAEDLAAMAPLVGLAADGPAGEVATSVVTALRSRRDWLVVFDNAQLPGDLAGMLPGGGGNVLITSRNRAWSGVALRLDLEVFSRNESVAFLYKRSGRSEPEAASNLARELSDLPLALAQAAAYIDARPFVTISGYLALYRDPVLARRLRDEGLESGEYPASVARTWLLTFRQLAGDRPAAVELLRLCAFLDPDDIDLDVLAAGATDAGGILAAALGDPLERMETAGTLAGASLVTATAEGRLRVHRLVQAVTRDQLDEDQAAAWSSSSAEPGRGCLPGQAGRSPVLVDVRERGPHVEAVTAYTERYPDLAVKRGGLLGQLGIYLAASAQFRTALSVLERALAIKEAAYGRG